MRSFLSLFTLGCFIIFISFISCKKNKPTTLTILGESTVSDITSNSAVVTGTSLEIGEDMQVYGHVWGETSAPDIASNPKSEHTKTTSGTFVDELTDLKPETKYYVRAYSKDGDEVIYKDAISFTTLPELQVLSVVTNEVTEIGYNSATCGGNVVNEGESPVTVRGVCWSTSENPTVADDTTINGTGSGAYVSNLTGLSELTTYYIRAYATNSEGTVYGEQNEFTTYELLIIGDFHEGGVIFYLDHTGIHGLVCAVTEQDPGSGTIWGCNGTGITGADAVEIGTGYQNTIDIEEGCTESEIAADLCANLVLNGYDDWFLPSLDELTEMISNIDAILPAILSNGGTGFDIGGHWSSSESDANYAWSVNVKGTSVGHDSKTDNNYVRAVRAF